MKMYPCPLLLKIKIRGLVVRVSHACARRGNRRVDDLELRVVDPRLYAECGSAGDELL